MRADPPQDKKTVAKNITDQARYARLLIIWTDCDREGEYIGHEIVEQAKKGNANIAIKRATFSNVERAHVISAARRLGDLDERQVSAVSARTELDLRTGYAFTRYLTQTLQILGGPLEGKTISYGSCQFPALGFVVDRYFKVKNFVPEPFWSIKVVHTRERKKVQFSWARNRLFERMSTVILYERCLEAKKATVTKVQEKPTRKFKPLPLTTVELQKAAARLLRMNAAEALKHAEDLYNKGFVSYPRTETDRFDKGMNLRALVQKQHTDERWGQYAEDLSRGGFQQPREGRHDDKAHPPIHPIAHCSPGASGVNPDQFKVYEYITRRFLACCSEDANGLATDVELEYGQERFNAQGVVVLERNYLDVFPYEKWDSTTELPKFTIGETFEPTEAMMTEGKTSPPSYLTEADLLALMDANGIGTDATMAEHIQTIQKREYVAVVTPTGNAAEAESEPHEVPAHGRGRGGARGGRGGRGRGGAAAGRRRGAVEVFIPTKLGVALIVGFDRMNFETSLGKPFLRKQMETKMKAICDGRMPKEVVLRETIAQYREVFTQTQEQLHVLKSVRNAPSKLEDGARC